MNARDTVALAGFGAVTAGAAALATKATREALYPWYVTLQKPPFQPPRQAFAPVWTALYGLIAVSGFRLWRAKKSTRRTVALTLWGGQLAANAAWSWLFFRKHQGKAALADIAALETLIVGTLYAALKVDAPAATMLAPYAAWVAFAGVLNEEIVRRNPPSAFAAHP
ncbi:MAG TPA: TspO/MBR family protein [Myxococcales bacterium]|jgi:tryptophan-rich sensory protein|nr:TspO/MBR family protein [Myxococcales bacterium]